jgi:predicted esterase
MAADEHDTLDLRRTIDGPHASARVLLAGADPARAAVAVLLCHGRGGSAEDMLGLRRELGSAEVTFAAPQAAGSSWYPLPFIAPLEDNEPHLSSALALVGAVVGELEDRGVPAERQLLLGFSQGGCLALEHAARNARRYGAVVGLSAGLIGPPSTLRDYGGDLQGTPVFLGCGDPDPHIPRERLEESARILRKLGGAVDLRLYPRLGHTINPDELRVVGGLLERLIGTA